MKTIKDKLTIGEVAELLDEGKLNLNIYDWRVFVQYGENIYIKKYDAFYRINKKEFFRELK